MLFIGSIATSLTVNLVSSLVNDRHLEKNHQRKIKAIENRIFKFTRKFEETSIDTNAFDLYLKNSSVNKMIYNHIFINFREEYKANNLFKSEIALSAIEYVNKIYEDMNMSKIQDEFIIHEYFDSLVDEIISIRHDILNLHEQAIVATIVDQIGKTSDNVIEEISKEIGKHKYIQNNDALEQVIINNSKRVFVSEVEGSKNLITSKMVINRMLFADMEVKIKEDGTIRKSYILNEDSDIPIVQCLELLDCSREKYLKSLKDREKHVNISDNHPNEFKAKGAIITAVGGMGKTISLISLWKHILDQNNRSVFYIQLNKVNESLNNNNYIMELFAEKLLYNSIFSSYPRHMQIEILNEFLSTSNSIRSRFVILLDGFNEIQPSKRHSIKSQIESLFHLEGVLVIVTTRPDLRFKLDSGLLAFCNLNALKKEKILLVLNQTNTYGIKPELRNLLSNVLMLTLYVQICTWIKKDEESKLFNFTNDIISESELISNFVESLLCKNYYERDQHSDQLMLTFSLKYLIPYIGYKLFKEKKFKIKDRYHLWEIIEEFHLRISTDSNHFYEKEIQDLLLEYLSEWKELFNKNFSDNFANEIINKSILIQSDEDGGYRFWHQNFRDYMTAIYICTEIYRSLNRNEISIEIKFEWGDTLLRYIGEILDNSERCANIILQELLDTISPHEGKYEIVLANILRVYYQKNHNISDLIFNSLNFSNISLYGVECINLTFSNCVVGWSLFEPYDRSGTTIFIKKLEFDRSSIVSSETNRVMYSPDLKQLHVLGRNGVVNLNEFWSSNIISTEFINMPMKEVLCSQICKNGRIIVISSNVEFKIIDIISTEVIKNFINKTYYTDDNRTYTNRVTKALFSEDNNSVLVLRENHKMSKFSFDGHSYIESIDHLKIKSCVSHDNNLFSYISDRELHISNFNEKFTKLILLNENYFSMTPLKFSYNCKLLALINKENGNIDVKSLNGDRAIWKIESKIESNIRFLEFSKCSEYIALVYDNNDICIYKSGIKPLIYRMKYQYHDVAGIAISNNAEEIFILDSNNRITILKRNSEEVVFSGVIQNIFFKDTQFNNCKFAESNDNEITRHLKLHGAIVKN